VSARACPACQAADDPRRRTCGACGEGLIVACGRCGFDNQAAGDQAAGPALPPRFSQADLDSLFGPDRE
jgi:hypothetical protein